MKILLVPRIDPLMHFKDADVDVNAGQKSDIRWGSRSADLLPWITNLFNINYKGLPTIVNFQSKWRKIKFFFFKTILVLILFNLQLWQVFSNLCDITFLSKGATNVKMYALLIKLFFSKLESVSCCMGLLLTSTLNFMF